MNNVPVTIVGVMTPELIDVQQAVREGPDIALPLALDSQLDMTGAGLLPGEPPRPPRLRAADLLVAAGDGPAEAGRDRGAGAGQSREACSSTPRGPGSIRYLASLSAEARGDSRNRNRTEVPHLRVDSGSRGIYDVNTSDSSAVTILERRRRPGPADRLRQRRQPAAVARGDAAARNLDPAVAGRDPRAARAPAAHREPPARGDGRRARRAGRPLGPAAAAGQRRARRRRSTGACWRSCSASRALTGLVFGIAPALRATGMNVSAR